jgi:hypothetical protein
MMNPRIQKLYEQSWVEGSYQEPIQGELGDEQRYRTVKTWNFDHEHFAQLIVKESVKALWTEDCHVSDLAIIDFNEKKRKIFNHMGITE